MIFEYNVKVPFDQFNAPIRNKSIFLKKKTDPKPLKDSVYRVILKLSKPCLKKYMNLFIF